MISTRRELYSRFRFIFAYWQHNRIRLVRMFLCRDAGSLHSHVLRGRAEAGTFVQYTYGQKILDILQASHCQIEDHNLVKSCRLGAGAGYFSDLLLPFDFDIIGHD